MSLEILLTKVILKDTCNECNLIPDFRVNRFAKWSKEWYTYYACKQHINKIITNRICADEFAEILEFDKTHLVQCYTCNNYHLDLPTLYSGENRYAGNCKFKERPLEGAENTYCRMCNQYTPKIHSDK
jgi:hypothetical protein